MSQAMLLRKCVCARGGLFKSVCLCLCLCVIPKCVFVFVCLFACVVLCVLTYADTDARRLSLEMLVSSVVVLALDWSFWTAFQLALSVVR